MSEETETSLSSEFNECQCIVENILQDKYGTGKNDKLRGCVDKLQQITKTIDNLSLFSTNDDVEELPTSSINYLLVPAYLGYALEEFNAGMEKRATYLSAAKIHYRQFLENLLIYRLIAFKLPWLHKKSEDDENDDKGDNVGRQKANLEKGSQRRQEKITRLNQRKKLEDALAQLKLKRNDDDFTERQAILTLIRLWSIRALESLSAIEDELKILDFAEKNKGKVLPDKGQSSKSVMAKPFIIAKTVAQKAVFGLGYPSIPTYTVDEWYDQMMAKKSFSEFPTTTTITGHENDGAESDGVDEDDLDESTREKKRQKAIQSDEWKDSHRRGWGNMHNKG